jgi:tRNA pseudouridine38-40 synthase
LLPSDDAAPDPDTPGHVALTLEYDGSAFHGFQLQSGQTSAQGILEGALSRIAAAPVRVVAAGRTDAGVHATAQVVSFPVPTRRPLKAWWRGANSLTPASLSVVAAMGVPSAFNARFSATARRYHYVILEAETRPALLHQRVTWSRRRLDDDAMHRAAQVLMGEHDFTSFRAASCQARTAYRCVQAISVRRFGAFVVIDVIANAFLHHMVRNIASALLQVGRGERPVRWVANVLAARRREVLGVTAPADGLYLVEVRYGTLQGLGAFRPPPCLGALGDIW